MQPPRLFMVLMLLGLVFLFQFILGGSLCKAANAESAHSAGHDGSSNAEDIAASKPRLVGVITPAHRKAITPHTLSAVMPEVASLVDRLIIIPAHGSNKSANDSHCQECQSGKCIHVHRVAEDSSTNQSSRSSRSSSTAENQQDCQGQNVQLLPHNIAWEGDVSRALNRAAAIAADAGTAWMLIVQEDDHLQVLDPVQALQQLSCSCNHRLLYCYTSNDTLSAKACVFKLPMHGHFEGPVDPVFIPASSERGKAGISADEHNGAHSDSCGANKEESSAHGPPDQQPSQEEFSSAATETPADGRCAGSGQASFIFRGVIRAPVQRSGEALRQHVRALQQHLSTRPPRDAWWLLQIAQAYEEAGYKSLALQYYFRAFKASRSRVLAAWAMYSLSVMHTAAADYPAVIDAASRGISKVPTPELLWIASFASYSMGNMQQAVAWAEMAASLGCMRHSSSSLCSIPSQMVFMDLQAWYSHPYDVLTYSYDQLGDASAASEAEATRSLGEARLKELLTAALSGHKPVVVAGLQALATAQEGQDLFETPAAARPELKIAASMTTAHRPQLFRRSWHSFKSRCLDCDKFIKQWYVMDDGSSQDDLQLMQSSAPPCAVSWLDKGAQFAGHAGSLNRLLEEVFEQGFDYLLHLEDDWWFMRDEEFISKALSVMEADPSIIQVLFNPDYRDLDADWEEQELHANMRYITADGVPYALHKYAGLQNSEEHQQYLMKNNITKSSHLHWPGFALRPGLWRLSAVKQVGLFADTGQFEEAYALRVWHLGFQTAFLTEVSCIHLAPTSPTLAEKDLAPVYQKHQLHLSNHQRQSAYDASISVR